LVHGGPANLESLLRFVAGLPCAPPQVVPQTGLWGTSVLVGDGEEPGRPTIGVVFYRAQLIAGNTQFVADLCAARPRRGPNARPVYCYSLRGDAPAVELLRGCDAVITTVLAAGSGTHDGDDWDPSALATLDVPVVQGVAATSAGEAWAASSAGLTPIDVAMQVAIPEFDGRIVTVPFSFKEVVDDGDELGSPVTAYRTVPDRVERVAGIAVRLARLRHVANEDKRVALVLSAYPTKRSRLGKAVALDTPASVLELLHALRDAGYRVDRIPTGGDGLMAEIADNDLAPVDLGHVLVAIQPPRGFGDNPVAVYHSPDLPPAEDYVAFYRWLDETWGAHAIVHVGKHGTLEWLPGKSVGLSAGCWPDRVLGDVPP